MTALASRLYVGTIVHLRSRPRRRRLRYRMAMLLVDLDELDSLDARLRLFGHNHFSLFGLYDRDHADRRARPLRPQIERRLAQAGIDAAGGPIRLLCLPRVIGHGFSPLAVYFCHRPGGDIAGLVYQVHNTFGGDHDYVLPAQEQDGLIRQTCPKVFRVSPFLGMDLRYVFDIAPPTGSVHIGVTAEDEHGPLLITAFTGRARPLDDINLLQAWIACPWLTLGPLAAIHWEALKLLLSGFRGDFSSEPR